MAIPDILGARLIETVKDNDLGGAFLMLGRQSWKGRGRGAGAEVFDETLAKYLPNIDAEDLKNPDDRYSERFFETLGFSSVDSLDFSDFEKASIVQDLGGTLPSELENRFDVIFDGGTCEHVFDLPTAYRNIDKMLRPGGVFISHAPANNWVAHGFYQISPEIVFGFWAQSMGYEVLHCVFQPIRPRAARRVVAITNPLVTGKRPKLKGALPRGMPVIMNFAVRKSKDPVEPKSRVLQSDYVVRWEAARK
ncbi:methyltransferase family protein [Yoonia maricola]|uniref:Methyltransferase family protein n=1 Tax=Yoonia maricola TaxID=420999 RepID=A0A2M8WN11_9RHOB|nr:class I SAM-dependent methyltransferase [Yoonia maricola]PJI92315.1 methyltransferase family protein [Yoonia maricola]